MRLQAVRQNIMLDTNLKTLLRYCRLAFLRVEGITDFNATVTLIL
jgi:hypothetical protein